jgi:hypothetical protein
MNRILLGLLLVSSFVVAQTVPKAVLLRLEKDETVVMGVLEGSKWVAADTISQESQKRIEAGLKTVLFDLDGWQGKAMVGGKFEARTVCDWNRVTDISTPVKLEKTTFAIDADWNVAPRVAKVLPNSNATYLKVVADELKLRKLKQPAVITQLLQVDLDNDKTSEMIVVAQTSSALKSNTGEYSLVLVRKVIAGKVKTFALEDFVIAKGYDAATDTGALQGKSNQITAIADIDGNGTMEIFIDDQVNEGYGVRVFNWTGKAFSKVLDWGCGS